MQQCDGAFLSRIIVDDLRQHMAKRFELRVILCYARHGGLADVHLSSSLDGTEVHAALTCLRAYELAHVIDDGLCGTSTLQSSAACLPIHL